LDEFRTLPSSQADGANKTLGRLTNLMKITVDTSWYTRYRSSQNPDFGATFPQAITLANVPAIPRTNADFALSNIQAIANIAAFHFGSIEQGGSSLYATLSQKVSSVEVLKITLSIGGDEICHFLEWVDFSGNSVQPPVAPLPAANGLPEFPNFDATVNPALQTNLIFPVPCEFIRPNLPKCAVIRPTSQGFLPVNRPDSSICFWLWHSRLTQLSAQLLRSRPHSIIDLLPGVARQIPARRQAELRKKRIHALFLLRRIGDVFHFPVFLWDCE